MIEQISTLTIGERHYTVAEVSEAWNLSADKVRRLFQDEPGVLVLENRILLFQAAVSHLADS